MVVTEICGGLGNQMFHYAAGLALAEHHHTTVGINDWPMKTREVGARENFLVRFNISGKIVSSEEQKSVKRTKWQAFCWKHLNFLADYRNIKVYDEPFVTFNRRFFNLPDGVFLQGYFFTEKYFVRIADKIRKEFTLKDEYNIIPSDLLSRVENSNSVSIHFRRGDYVAQKALNKAFGVPGEEYYRPAIEYIKDRIREPKFFIFSDDLPWVKENFKLEGAEYVSLLDYEELVLMSKCKHNIVANSSFSWWAAWLNSNSEKIVIAPRRWYRWWRLNCKDIVPSNWVRL